MITTLGMHQRDRVVAGVDLHSHQPTILISYLGRRRPLISCGRDGLERGDPDDFPATDLGVGLAAKQLGLPEGARATTDAWTLRSPMRASFRWRQLWKPRREGWDEVMSIDGRGMFLTCRYAIEQMITTGGDRLSVLHLGHGGPVAAVDLRSGEVRGLRPHQTSGC
jgi:hypothetical protein